MNARQPEWVRFAALEYVRTMASYKELKQMKLDRIDELKAIMEGLGAARYDREGGAAPYRDRIPDIIDTIEEMVDTLAGDIERGERDYQRALDLFGSCEEAQVVWEKYGLGLQWKTICMRHSIGTTLAWTMAQRGFRHIFDNMPPEYRRVHVNAEEWER